MLKIHAVHSLQGQFLGHSLHTAQFESVLQPHTLHFPSRNLIFLFTCLLSVSGTHLPQMLQLSLFPAPH